MATYEEVYDALAGMRDRYLSLSIKAQPQSLQKQRCLRTASIAQIFMEQIEGLQGEIEGGIIEIQLSLEELIQKLSESNPKVSTWTLISEIRGLAVETGADYQLGTQKISPSRTAKRRRTE